MNIELPIIRKSSIRGLLLRTRQEERDLVQTECRYSQTKALQELQGQHEIELMRKDSEISMLNRRLDEQERKLKDAIEKEERAKVVYLKASELISRIDYEFKKHGENTARSMAQFRQIRLDSDQFGKNLIGENK